MEEKGVDSLQLLPGHALSGCDTVGMCYMIGKMKMIKVLKKGFKFKHLGHAHSDMTEVIQEAISFMTSCYGSKSNSMSDARIAVWKRKTGNSTLMAPELKAIPPTDAAFIENVKRAHYQAIVWRQALTPNADVPNPLQLGFYLDEEESNYMPIKVPTSVSIGPDRLLKLIKCGCSSKTSCKSLICSCAKSGLPCTMFCQCKENCLNPLQPATLIQNSVSDSESDDELY